MRRPSTALLAPAFILALALVAACESGTVADTPAPPTPTPTDLPTSTPTPLPTDTPTPTATPTITPTPLPTDTPTPTPTVTPTPTPTPTATPPPSPTPTPTLVPTATPTLIEATDRAEPAMVRLSHEGTHWTGVMIDPSGRILTSSFRLGQAPIADFATQDGSTGRAWVVGRNDEVDLALLEVINPVPPYTAIEVSAEAPRVDQELVALHYAGRSPVLDTRPARVVRFRQSSHTGFGYVQLQGLPPLDGAEGGALVDNAGALRALRMRDQHVVDIDVGLRGDVYGITSDGLARSILPDLEAGFHLITAPSPGRSPGVRPSLPADYSGNITVGGSPAPAGTQVYAKVSSPNKDDLWFTKQTRTAGRYFLSFDIGLSGYNNAAVEFWVNAQAASTRNVYRNGLVDQTFDLVFP